MADICTHFTHLNARLTELTNKLIADQMQSETEDVSNFKPDLDRLAAYRLLIHAEIEDFLEAKAKENINKIKAGVRSGSDWMANHPEIFSLAILLYNHKKLAFKNGTDNISNVLSEFVTSLLNCASIEISENNGIKSPSFTLLSVCAGKGANEIDGALSLSLNAYGRSRGDVAHKSAARSTSILAPSAEYFMARNLVASLKVFFDVVEA